MPPLRTIKQILTSLDFLEYSTHKRNLAYQIQYLEFKRNILKSELVYGSVQACLMRELIIGIANIIEYLLFISLRKIYGDDPRSHKFPSLVGQAKRSHLICKGSARDLNEIEKLRNKIHPSKQKRELDINCFTKKEVYSALASLDLLERELNKFFGSQKMQVDIGEGICKYEGYSQVLFPDFYCPYCDGYHF